MQPAPNKFEFATISYRILCRGMKPNLSKGGKLVDMERVVVDFHRFLGTRLGQLSGTALFEDEAAARWKNAKQPRDKTVLQGYLSHQISIQNTHWP